MRRSLTHPHEVILAEIPGSNAEERLLIVHRNFAGESRIELRQQTWGEGIGWFTQNTMRLEPQQVAQLRATLGGASAACPSPTVQFADRTPAERPQLRIHAESA